MSERLAELVRQRALVQEHLAWLNREIAHAAEAAKAVTAAGNAPPAPAGVAESVAPPPAPAALPAATAMAMDAEEIIARYQPAPTSVKQDVRKGCLLYFAAAFVLLGLVVTVLYFVLSTRR